jgi:hypothetical protein
VADELQGGEAPRRPHVEVLPTVSRYHKAFGRVHIDALLWLRRAACVERPHVAIPRETDHFHLASGSRARPFDGRMAETVYDSRSTSRA